MRFVIEFLLCLQFVYLLFGQSQECLHLKNKKQNTVNRSFTIDYERDTFLKDGKPYRYISGSIHYGRVPRFYWKDRMLKMYAAGLTAIQTYVLWNLHEPNRGEYNFDGDADIEEFIKMAQDVGLDVILRVGPYICGEWDFGGFPGWLISKNKNLVLRSSDPDYLKEVDRWLGVILPKVKPLLYQNGGPIISVQVENEYGSFYTCDKKYTHHLRDTFRHYLGQSVVLFTTDGAGAGYLKCGKIDGVYATVDFGPGSNASLLFKPQRDVEPHGPLVNSEYYAGWLDHWGAPHANISTASVVKGLDDILSLNASINIYMFEGGTNFGYTNGADPTFAICPTSYDYDAPLSEAGDITPKYTALRKTISKYRTLPPIPVPPTLKKHNYGFVKMQLISTVIDALSVISVKSVVNDIPLTMENIGQNYGFALYRHVIKTMSYNSTLEIPDIRDRGYVSINQNSVGIVDRNGATSVSISRLEKGDQLNVLVENQGHINFGSTIVNNSKGILNDVLLDKSKLFDWEIYSINFTKFFDQSSRPKNLRKAFKNSNPSIYVGRFTISPAINSPMDTFLRLDGWSKGQAFLNGFNLGRYWPRRGPQLTLYVPASLIKVHPHQNTVLLVELEKSPCSDDERLPDACRILFTESAVLNGNTTNNPPSTLPSSHTPWKQYKFN